MPYPKQKVVAELWILERSANEIAWKPWAAKYDTYFVTTAPWLPDGSGPKGKIGSVPITALISWPEQLDPWENLRFVQLIKILESLEEASPKDGGFDEFDGAMPQGLTYDEITFVWLRRLAVALWSDANEHWPWHLNTLSGGWVDHLLGWHPAKHRNLVTPGSGCLRFPLDPKYWEKAFGSNNGHGIYFDLPESSSCLDPVYESLNDPGDAYLTDDEKLHFCQLNSNPCPYQEDKKKTYAYHFGFVWDANPLTAWAKAHAEVVALVDGTSRAAGVFAATQWLNDREFYHGEEYKTPIKVHLKADVSLANVIKLNFGGCAYNSPLMASLLRAMNIPSVVMRMPVVNAACGQGAGAAGRHHTVVCPSPDVALGLFHGDDVLADVGKRWADPKHLWVPFVDWALIVLAQYGELSGQAVPFSGGKAGEFQSLLRRCSSVLGMRWLLPKYSDWHAPIVSAATTACAKSNNKSWLDYAEAVFELDLELLNDVVGGGANVPLKAKSDIGDVSVNDVVSWFFGLDQQPLPVPTPPGRTSKFQFCNYVIEPSSLGSRFPQSCSVGVQFGDVEKIALATLPEVIAAVAAIALMIKGISLGLLP